MPELVDIKRTPADKKENKEEITKFGEEDYAWGTQIRLDEIEAEKLGIMGLNVGDEVDLLGIGKVISKSMRESEQGGSDGSIEIQMTQLGIAKSQGKTAAEKLYGDASDDNKG